MTDTERAELKRLAEAATPGPWEHANCGGHLVMAGPLLENRKGLVRGGRGQIAEMDDTDFGPRTQRANARFIAAANPAAVLDLLNEHEEDQGVIAVWRGRAERALKQAEDFEAENECLKAEIQRLQERIDDYRDSAWEREEAKDVES